MGSSGLSLWDTGSSSFISATTVIFYFFPVCQLSYLWSCIGKQISEISQIINMILLTIFIIIRKPKGEGKGGNVLNYFLCWTDNDAGPSPFWCDRPTALISVRYFPGSCGSLTGLKDTFFQKNILCTQRKYKASREMVKATKTFSPRIWPAACPPPSLWDDSYTFIFPVLHMASAATHLLQDLVFEQLVTTHFLLLSSAEIFQLFLVVLMWDPVLENKPIYPD